MRTKIYMVVAILLLIGVGMIPWIDGYLFKQHYINFLNSLATEKQSKIKVLEYHLGWLSSTARISMEPIDLNVELGGSTPAMQSQMNVTFLNQTIKHGPYVFDDAQGMWTFARAIIQSHITLPAIVKSIMTSQDSQADVRMNTVVTLSGNYLSQFSSAPFTVMPILPGKMIWQGMKGNINLFVSNNQVTQAAGHIDLGAVNAQFDTNAIVWSGMTYQYDMSAQNNGLWVGKQSIALPEFSMSKSGMVIIGVRGINLDFSSDIGTNKYYNVVMQASLNSLVTADISIGPSTLKLSLEHFNLKGMADFIRVSRGVSKTMLATHGQQRPEMAGFLPKAITPITVINESATIVTSSGKLGSTGQIFWPKNMALPTTLEDVIANAGMKMNLRISTTLVNRLIDTYYHHQQGDAASASEKTAQLSEPTEAGLLAQVDVWTSQNQIPLDVSFQIKDFIKRHLSQEVFAANVDPFVTRKEISAEIVDQLKQKYAVLHPEPTPPVPGAAATAAITPTPPPPPVVTQVKQVSPADGMRNIVAEWVKMGCLIQDEEDYVTTITYEQGVLKCNGVLFNNLSLPAQ
jgi:uncharacterized protein YdgA (DUF945 family)